jgi:hypothetical protein
MIFTAIFKISLSKMLTKNDQSFKLRQMRQIVVFGFHPTSHLINSKHEAFGPLPMGLRSKERKVERE